MITFGLSIVVVTNTIDEDHQYSDRHEEECCNREWIDPDTDLEPGIPCREPIENRGKRLLAKMA